MGADELDDDLADDILEAARDQTPPKSIHWFADEFDISPKEIQLYLKSWVAGGAMTAVQSSDGTWLFFAAKPGDAPFEASRQLLSDINGILLDEDFAEPKPLSWFAEKVDSDHWKTHWALKKLEEVDSVSEHKIDGALFYAPPYVDAIADTPQLHETNHGKTKLVFPDGESHSTTITTYGECTVARSHSSYTAAVFVDDEFSFLLEDDDSMSDVAIGANGHLAYHTGPHRGLTFHISTWEGEVLLEEPIAVARAPVFSPDGDYVAYWELTDHTIYIYDIATNALCGEFDTETLRKTNIGLKGVSHNGDPAFSITDTYGRGDDELLGYLSPKGELLESEVASDDSERLTQDEPSDEDILNEIADEFELGL